MSDPSLATTLLHQQIDRLRAGDRAAQEDLVWAIAGRMERLARAMLRDFPNVRRWADTQDVFQNAVMRLLATLRNIKPASTRDFYGLAAVHIRRELLDLARQFSARKLDEVRLISQAPAGTDLLGDAADAEPSVDRLETWHRLHEAIEGLPAEQRETVGLIFYHGWEQRQVAEVLGVSDRQVRRYWREACQTLQQELGDGVSELLG